MKKSRYISFDGINFSVKRFFISFVMILFVFLFYFSVVDAAGKDFQDVSSSLRLSKVVTNQGKELASSFIVDNFSSSDRLRTTIDIRNNVLQGKDYLADIYFSVVNGKGIKLNDFSISWAGNDSTKEDSVREYKYKLTYLYEDGTQEDSKTYISYGIYDSLVPASLIDDFSSDKVLKQVIIRVFSIRSALYSEVYKDGVLQEDKLSLFTEYYNYICFWDFRLSGQLVNLSDVPSQPDQPGKIEVIVEQETSAYLSERGISQPDFLNGCLLCICFCLCCLVAFRLEQVFFKRLK